MNLPARAPSSADRSKPIIRVQRISRRSVPLFVPSQKAVARTKVHRVNRVSVTSHPEQLSASTRDTESKGTVRPVLVKLITNMNHSALGTATSANPPGQEVFVCIGVTSITSVTIRRILYP